ncbi:hypothetical protein Y032_1077g3555 [Ancylostoma ceylanicum]|uniref:Uncharacterized protein n=1 Tax=Ancylostoma ceylanicum TaxID=53326 RepID=A0A016W6R8_9BILA|nr:hypothetical protein Y032_1077g3555 [Ancylostoma ceylanicum]
MHAWVCLRFCELYPASIRPKTLHSSDWEVHGRRFAVTSTNELYRRFPESPVNSTVILHPSSHEGIEPSKLFPAGFIPKVTYSSDKECSLKEVSLVRQRQ